MNEGLTQEELDAELAEQHAIAEAAGTCCPDPTPAKEAGDGPDAGRMIHWCQACGVELEPDVYAALVADPEAARTRIARVRAERRGGC